MKDPNYMQSGDTSVCRYTLAVDRKFKRDGEQSADFISCVAFGRNADFAEKYLHKGTKIAVKGSIQTGSYVKDGKTNYTTSVVVDTHEFVESKSAAASNAPITVTAGNSAQGLEGFMNMSSSDMNELPFS